MGSSAQGPNALIGQMVAGYRLERVLGVGATGAVFLGARADTQSDTPTGGEVVPATASLPASAAIKLLYVPWQLSDEQTEEFRRRFLREAETLSELKHPHLLPVLASGQDAATGHLYMVMPHIAGTLASRLTAAGGALPLPEASSILDQLAGALDYAHSQGVIHRDIKPANILLDEQGHVYLGDFGVLRLLDESRTQLTTTGGVLGTPEYMAPEQARGEEVGPAADRYALAVALYQMVTGHLPFEGGTPASVIVRQMQDPPPIPRSYRADLPEPAEAVILKGLAKLPADRFALSSQMAEAFALGLAGVLSPLVTPTGPQQAQTLSDGRIAEAPATPLSWAPYPEAPALPAGTAPPRRRTGILWGSLGAAVLLLLTAAVLAALVRPDLTRALFGGKTATASATSQGQDYTNGYPPGATAYGGIPTGAGGAASTAATKGAGTPGAQTPTSTFGGTGPAATDTPQFSPTNTPTPPPPAPQSVAYIGSGDGGVYAINISDGSLRWRYQTGANVADTPAVVNNVVYIGSDDHNVYALDANTGAPLWHTATGGTVESSPAVSGGVVYIGSSDGNVYALNASNGSVIWTFTTGGPVLSSPVVANGLVYVGSNDYNIYALRASDGGKAWSYTLRYYVTTAPLVVGGVVYVGDANWLWALDANTGAMIRNVGDGPTSSPTVENGVLYVGGRFANLFAYNLSDLSQLWATQGSGVVRATPADPGGYVFIARENGALQALNPANGLVHWSVNYLCSDSSPIFVNDVLYLGDSNGRLDAVVPATGALIWSYQTGGNTNAAPTIGP